MADNTIKRIDSRMGKRGKRQTFSFSGVEAQEHIDEYMEEVRMTKADLESYKTAASTAAEVASTASSTATSAATTATTAAEAAAKAADDAADAASKVTDGVVEACNEAAEKATTAATTATESATSAEMSAAEAKKAAEQAGASVSGVSSWNGRSGNVMPQSGDYTADMVDAVSTAAFNTALEQATQGVNEEFLSVYRVIDGLIKNVVLDGTTLTITTYEGNKTTFTTQDTTYSNATTSTAGLMSASDKAKLNGIATGATKVTVDSALSSTSTNPVQNKAVYTALSNKADTASTVKSLSISGTTITVTFGDGSTSTLTTQDTNTTYSAATTSAAGLMSASDKTKLNGIATGATKVTVDSALSSTSTNPVRNSVIYSALSNKANTTDLETVTTEVNARPSTRRLATQTLTASGGTLTWTDDAIGDDALIDVYASIPNIAPSEITQSGTTVTVTFDAQDSAFDVAIVVM